MDRGFVKLWRRSFDSAAFADPILWKLWCLCLMKANYKKNYVEIEGIANPVEVLPGQFITGRFALHREFYPKPKKKQKSPITLWRKLETLQNMQNLNIRSHAKYSIITIINWEQYQQSEQPVNNRRTTGEQPMNTEKKEKKEKKEKNREGGNNTPQRFIPPKLEEVEDYCKGRKNNINPKVFIDWNQSKGWMIGKNKMKDWKAAIRTWEQRNKDEILKNQVDEPPYW